MRFIASLAALVLAATPALAGKRIDEFVSGYWTTYAYQNDDGSFGHCGMETTFDDGMVLSVLLADGGVIVAFWHPDWRLKVGATTALQMQIDRRYDTFAGVTIDDPRGMVSGLGFDAAFWTAFKAGNTMNLALADGRAWTVNLKGSSKATKALTVCFDLYAPNGRKGMFN